MLLKFWTGQSEIWSRVYIPYKDSWDTMLVTAYEKCSNFKHISSAVPTKIVKSWISAFYLFQCTFRLQTEGVGKWWLGRCGHDKVSDLKPFGGPLRGMTNEVIYFKILRCSISCVGTPHLADRTNSLWSNMLIVKSREWHNHKPQPTPDTKRKRKGK